MRWLIVPILTLALTLMAVPAALYFVTTPGPIKALPQGLDVSYTPTPSPTAASVETTAASPLAPSAATNPAAEIVTRTLSNGLQVIVWPDHDIPNVALYNWFHVGSRNEQVGRTGLAHFFEHMMFNGAERYGPGEFDRVMEAGGGSNNAFTTEDVTVYQDWIPRSALDLTLDLEADRIGHLAIDPEMVESEREVVLGERRSNVDDDDLGFLWEQTAATAFLAHPYQNPVLGWPSDIEKWTQGDLEAFFKTYYAPNNATMVVVGDVDPEAVFDLAERKLGSIPRQPPGPEMRTVEPEQTGERRLVVERAAQAPYVIAGFHSGTPRDADRPALDLLMTILVDGDSSRLHRRLVEEAGAAIEVDGFVDGGFDPKLSWIWATLPPDGDTDAVEALLWEELARIADSGVTEAELARAKRIHRADYWRNLKTISGKADAMGQYAVIEGDFRRLFDAPARDAAVTNDQIRAVAAKVFAPNNSTVGILQPAVDEEETEEATP